MNKILKALTDAIAAIFGNRANVTALKQQIADRDKIIANLVAALEAETRDDAALEAAVLDAEVAKAIAEQSLAALNTEIAKAEAKADELAAAITIEPAIPITITADGTVTPQ